MLVGLACLAFVLAACEEREDLDGERRALPGLPERAVERPRDLGDRRVAYDLFDSRPLVGVHARDSLVVDMAAVGLAVHTDGGARSRWLPGDGAARVDGLGAELWVPLDRDAGGAARRPDGSLRIAWRARAAAEEQLVSVFLNEHKLGDVAMPSTEWASYEVVAPAGAVVEGENKLRFYFRHSAEVEGAEGTRSAADFRRIVFGGAADPAEAGLTAEAVDVAGDRFAALATPGASRLSFHLLVPADAPALVVSTAGEAELAVRVASTAGVTELWRGRGAAAWSDHEIDLGRFAGRLVRLDLASDAAVAWGRPQVVAADPGAARDVSDYDHIVVWSVASLRADRVLGNHPAGRDYRRADGLRGRLRAPAADPARAHAAILAGRRDVGASLPEEVVTLAERLRRAGYATALLSGNGFVHDGAGFARGFESYQNPMRRRRHHGARALWELAERFLAGRTGDRTFVYLATSEPHLPYSCGDDRVAWAGDPVGIRGAATTALSEAVRNRRRALIGLERRYVTALYDACVAANAEAFAAMRASLEELGIAERTAVVLVGDHGEELWERGGFGRSRDLFDEGVLVPLVISAPGLPARELASDAELVDLHPTVLALAGVAPPPTLHGQSLLGAPPTVPAPTFLHAPGQGRAIVWGGMKLVLPARGALELYDLGADPGERRDVLTAEPIAARALRNVLGLQIAFESAWSTARWGEPHRLKPAFTADQGG